MAFLLDTNVVSEARKGRKCDPNVAAWLESHNEASMFISSISMMEIRLGIHLAQNKNPDFAARLELWYESKVKPEFGGRIVPIDLAVAETCARLNAARPRPFRDGLIGSSALVHGLTMVTRNIADFSGMGLDPINPWHA